MSTVPGLNAEVSLLNLRGKNSISGSTPQVTAALLPSWPRFSIKFQRSYAQCNLAWTAAVWRHASKCRHLLLKSFRPGFWEALLRSPGGTHGWRRLCSVPGLVVLPHAPATDSCAIPPAAKIHCWNYTFLSGHVCIWQGFVDTTSLTAVHIFTRFTSSTLFPS